MAGDIPIIETAESFTARIYIAGSYEGALAACREWCERGACVSVSPAEYVYTRGQESGVVVTLINYPRFPKERSALEGEAIALARLLIKTLHQDTASVETLLATHWLSRRGERAPQ